ncbi:MAG: hypothetical protein KAI70_08520, partial [Candidatus Omnitrophica bacterium]|nr:hypothetical protein [Candidatus Omnitrophota bacterium]
KLRDGTERTLTEKCVITALIAFDRDNPESIVFKIPIISTNKEGQKYKGNITVYPDKNTFSKQELADLERLLGDSSYREWPAIIRVTEVKKNDHNGEVKKNGHNGGAPFTYTAEFVDEYDEDNEKVDRYLQRIDDLQN